MSALVQAIQQLNHLEWLQTFDQTKPGSRATSPQQQLLDAILNCSTLYIECRSGNRSGKTATMAKALAVMLREEPDDQWKRPAHWVGPLLLLVLGRQSKQVDESIWPKIRMHLRAGTYREVRVGNSLQKVVMSNGNVLLTFSHHNVAQAQQAVQSFDANLCVIDELPSHPSLIEEAEKRVLLRKGSLVLTYTPKQPGPKVKAYLEALPAHLISRIRLSSLDNPAMDQETRDKMYASAASQGQSALNTILYGEWTVGDRAVYGAYDPTTCMVQLPEHYSPQIWRHVACVDPAVASASGVIVLGEDPNTHIWYVVHASYVTDIADPAEIVRAVEGRMSSFRIVRRIYDTAATWFAGAARAQRFIYLPIENKAHNKHNFIAAVNAALGQKVFLTEGALPLEEELLGAQWSETGTGDKIAAAHDYHCADALLYCLQLLPSPEQAPAADIPLHTELKRAHLERIGFVSKEKPKRVGPGVFRVRRGGG